MKYLKKYPELEPLMRSERYQAAILEQLFEINEKLDTLVKGNVSNVKSNQEAAVKKTRKKAEVK